MAGKKGVLKWCNILFLFGSLTFGARIRICLVLLRIEVRRARVDAECW